MRINAPTKGEKPYDWNSAHVGQCTWGAYYRTIEECGIAPCYWDGDKKIGTFTDAKNWGENLHEGFVRFPIDHKLKDNDLYIFDGKSGHVIYIEKVYDNGIALISHWNKNSDGAYVSEDWTIGTIIKGKKINTGNPKCIIHPVLPVEKNNKNQVKVNTNEQNLRNSKGEVIGTCLSGYFNVLKTKQDNYTWYEIDEDVWIAGIGTRVEFIKGEDKEDYEVLYNKAQEKLEKIKEILNA